MEKTAAEKREARFQAWSAPAGLEFASAEAKAAYRSRVALFKDIVLMEKLPERVPILPFGIFMYPGLYGISPYDSLYDTDRMLEAQMAFLRDYNPDYFVTPALIGQGKVFDILGYKQYKLPGHGISKDSGWQYVEGEYMLADEYDALIKDPSDFWIRTLMPRAYGALEPLKMLSPFTDMWEAVLVSAQMIPFGIPPVREAMQALLDAGQEAMAWIMKVGAFEAQAKGAGFPGCFGGATKAPLTSLGIP